jgi:hypothetical protein
MHKGKRHSKNNTNEVIRTWLVGHSVVTRSDDASTRVAHSTRSRRIAGGACPTHPSLGSRLIFLTRSASRRGKHRRWLARGSGQQAPSKSQVNYCDPGKYYPTFSQLPSDDQPAARKAIIAKVPQVVRIRRMASRLNNYLYRGYILSHHVRFHRTRKSLDISRRRGCR